MSSRSQQLTPMDNRPDEIVAMTQKLRSAIYEAVSEHDMTAIMAKQVELAKAGDTRATKTVLDYMLGGAGQKIRVEKVSVHTQLRQQEQDDQVDRTVRQIERLEPQAERAHRLLSMVMDKAPAIEKLLVLGENQLEQAERWATAQAAAMRQAAKGKKDVDWPDKPAFL